MTRKIFTLILCIAAFVSTQAQVKMTIAKATKAPVVDAYIDANDDPWTGTWVDLATAKSANTTTAMSAKYQLLYGDDAFYLAVQVEDATPNNDTVAIPNSYERDCAEIFFKMDTIDAAAGAYSNGAAGCWQIRMQRAIDEGGKFIEFASKRDLAAAEAGVQAMCETSATGYIQEFIFPFATLNTGSTFDGKFFKFELQVADNTTGAGSGRTQQMFWKNGSDSQWNNSTTFSVVKLATPVSNKTVSVVKASAIVRNNMLKVSNVSGIVSIYDLKGTLVRKSMINGFGSIDIADIKSGLYIAKGNNLSVKFVK